MEAVDSGVVFEEWGCKELQMHWMWVVEMRK